MPNDKLMRHFVNMVNSKDLSKKDYYTSGRQPIRREIGKRHLTGKDGFNFKDLLTNANIAPERQQELLQETIYTLVDDRVIDDMRIKLQKYQSIVADDEHLRNKILGELFVQSLMSMHGISASSEAQIKTVL